MMPAIAVARRLSLFSYHNLHVWARAEPKDKVIVLTPKLHAAILLLLLLVVACTDTGSKVPTPPAVASFGLEPTFIVKTATPGPIDTPVISPSPGTGPTFTGAELVAPVFPDWLDPEITDEQPADMLLLDGWREYLSDVLIVMSGGEIVFHLCADGVLISETFTPGVEWVVTRTASVPGGDWGKITVSSPVQSGDVEGTMNIVALLSRHDGRVWQLGWGEPIELKIGRSRACLDL